MPDPYETLQVSRAAEIEIIEAAYRSLARKYHPDTNSPDGSTGRMQEINAAYEILKDPGKRREYDRTHPDPLRYYRSIGGEVIDWSELDEYESAGWGSLHSERRPPPAPVRRPNYLSRNWGCILYIVIAVFAAYQIIMTVAQR